MRLCFGVSCGIARARSSVCDHVRARRARRGHVVAVAVPWRGVAVVTWPWRPWVWPWRGAAVAVTVIVAAVAVRPLDAITAVAVASWTSCRDRGCGFCVAVMWLRHADER